MKDVSFTTALGTKTAIIGPTAAGKTQLLNMLAGLSIPHSGSVKYDGRLLSEYERDSFFRQVGLVFQDSVLFNATIRENIAFSALATDDGLRLAVDTAELTSYIASLPQGLDGRSPSVVRLFPAVKSNVLCWLCARPQSKDSVSRRLYRASRCVDGVEDFSEYFRATIPN
ncbi:MAG: ATP-binding cassette domain-containing protein [Pirellulaceae bacterium]